VSYEPTRIDVSGNLPIQRSVLPGEAPGEMKPGELAVNAADGVVYVGTNDGSVTNLPKAIGFAAIQVLEQGDYDALVDATATIATTLYIVTPDPE
jgi:hypothetical protein